MSLLKVKRAAVVVVGLTLATGALVVAAGTASADSDRPDATDNPSVGSTAASDAPGGPSPAHDVTPAGVPVYGLLDSVSSAPKRLSPEKGQ